MIDLVESASGSEDLHLHQSSKSHGSSGEARRENLVKRENKEVIDLTVSDSKKPRHERKNSQHEEGDFFFAALMGDSDNSREEANDSFFGDDKSLFRFLTSAEEHTRCARPSQPSEPTWPKRKFEEEEKLGFPSSFHRNGLENLKDGTCYYRYKCRFKDVKVDDEGTGFLFLQCQLCHSMR